MKYAAIDIGTNSILCLIAKAGKSKKLNPLSDLCEIPRLGEGLSQKPILQQQAMQRSLAVLKRYRKAIDQEKIPPTHVRVFATAGMRRAENAEDFINQVARETGLLIEVIDGKKEAYLSYLGVVYGLADLLPPEATLLIMDIGGGSTELIRAPVKIGPNAIESCMSLPLGSVWFTEKFLKASDPPSPQAYQEMSHEIEKILMGSGMNWQNKPLVVGIAGTVTTLAALSLKMQKYDAKKIQGSRICPAS